MSFVTISKVKYPSGLRGSIYSIGLNMVSIAKSQPGLISIAFHESCDHHETMMYWEWESKAHHELCMQSPAWASIMEKSGDIFQSEGVEFSIQTYKRLA